jgi:gliding motility-associated-like protein
MKQTDPMCRIPFSLNMFCKTIVLLAAFGSGHLAASAQTIFYNNGAQVIVSSGAIIQVNGGFQNDGVSAVFENNGTITVANSSTTGSVYLTNGSSLQGNGNYFIEQNWTNDAAFLAGNSTVTFNGNLHEFITSTNGTVTTFNNLILTGTGIGSDRKKTLQAVNANIGTSGTLSINDRELETLSNTLFVLNPSSTCVTNTSTIGNKGFVSSDINGRFSRVTNSTSSYIYPTGSSVGITRYRPLMVTPSTTLSNQYAARIGNNNAGTDGFNTSALDANTCSVNPLFYHQIDRTSGTANASIDIFYDQTTDGSWDGIAQWNTPTAASWNNTGIVTATSGSPLSDILKINWADFSNSPFILAQVKPAMPILNCASVCNNSTGNTFTASGSGTIYTWSSPAGTNISSGQGTNSVNIDWGTTSGTVTVSTTTIPGCTSLPATCLVTPQAPPVADFDTTSSIFTFNFTDLTVGATSWTWNFGDGTLSALQNPSHTYSENGVQSVCLTAAINSCADTTCKLININVTDLLNIPNVFTPDGDGENDFFFINNNGMKEFQIDIFNRWGTKVFSSSDAAVKWDGRSAKGSELSDGTYFFILKAVSINKKDVSTTGFVSLFRNRK